jgi:hypothetical protein
MGKVVYTGSSALARLPTRTKILAITKEIKREKGGRREQL